MKKIVFLLFVCLNLFAQDVYDLRDKTTSITAYWFIENGNDFEKYPIDNYELKKLFPKEYSKMQELRNSMDREDKFNELVTKAKALTISPKVGDIIIYGNRNDLDTKIHLETTGYHDGKFYMQTNSQSYMLSDSALDIYFFPESRDFAKNWPRRDLMNLWGKLDLK